MYSLVLKSSERKGRQSFLVTSDSFDSPPTTDGEMENSRRNEIEPDSVPNVSRRHRGKTVHEESNEDGTFIVEHGIASQRSEVYQNASSEKTSNSQLSDSADSIETTHGEDKEISTRFLSRSESKTKSYIANERTRTIRRGSAQNDKTKVLRTAKDKENVIKSN